jgi:KUP system potassium uptake protein
LETGTPDDSDPLEPPRASHRRVSAASHATTAQGRDLTKLAIGALGIVYGDIGTSPLYALRECLSAEHGVAATPANVLGILSLMFWSLVAVVVVKYLVFVLRADELSSLA